MSRSEEAPTRLQPPGKVPWKHAPRDTVKLTLKEFSQFNACFYFAVRGRIFYFVPGPRQVDFLLGAGIERTDIFTVKELQNLKWVLGEALFRSWTLRDAMGVFFTVHGEELSEG